MADVIGGSVKIKIGDEATPTEAFTDIARARVESWDVTNTEVDGRAKDTAGRATESVGTASVVSIVASVTGIVNDGAGWAIIRDKATHASDPSMNLELIDGTGDKWSGKFTVTAFSVNGPDRELAEFSATFSSNGAITIGSV